MFAMQHQGWCASSRRAHLTYRRYGKSNRCRNGKGGPWANTVYVLRGTLICFVLRTTVRDKTPYLSKLLDDYFFERLRQKGFGPFFFCAFKHLDSGMHEMCGNHI